MEKTNNLTRTLALGAALLASSLGLASQTGCCVTTCVGRMKGHYEAPACPSACYEQAPGCNPCYQGPACPTDCYQQ